MTGNGGLLTIFGVNMMPCKERLRCGGEGFPRDKVSLTCRKASVFRGRGSMTSDRSRMPSGGADQMKDKVTQVKTRR